MLSKSILRNILAAMLVLPAAAYAEDKKFITINNHISKPITAYLSGGACSTIIGASGVTQAGLTNKISLRQLKIACSGAEDPYKCDAWVYTNNNCIGATPDNLATTSIAHASFDSIHGILVDVKELDNTYKITGKGTSEVTISYAEKPSGAFNWFTKALGW